MTYKKYQNSRQFSKDLGENLKSSCYLFMGEEEGEKDKIITRMIQIHIQDKEGIASSTGRYYLNDDRNISEEFLSAAEFTLSSSMFSSKKVAIIKNIDNMKVSDRNRTLVEELLSQIPDGTVLILTTAKNSIPALFEKPFPESGTVVQFWKYFENDTFNYIQRSFSERGLKADSDAIGTLISLTGNDIKKIDEAIDMLFYAGYESAITADSVRYVVGETREITVFEFVDLLFSGNRKALNFLVHLKDEGVADLLILNMILRQVDLIEKYYLLTDNHLSPDEAMKKIGVGFSKPRKEKFTLFIKKIKKESIARIYPLISRADYRIKNSSSGNTRLSNPVFELAQDILFLK